MVEAETLALQVDREAAASTARPEFALLLVEGDKARELPHLPPDPRVLLRLLLPAHLLPPHPVSFPFDGRGRARPEDLNYELSVLTRDLRLRRFDRDTAVSKWHQCQDNGSATARTAMASVRRVHTSVSCHP